MEFLDIAMAKLRAVQEQLSNKRQGYASVRHAVDTVTLGRTFDQLFMAMREGMEALDRHRDQLFTAAPPPTPKTDVPSAPSEASSW